MTTASSRSRAHWCAPTSARSPCVAKRPRSATSWSTSRGPASASKTPEFGLPGPKFALWALCPVADCAYDPPRFGSRRCEARRFRSVRGQSTSARMSRRDGGKEDHGSQEEGRGQEGQRWRSDHLEVAHE